MRIYVADLYDEHFYHCLAHLANTSKAFKVLQLCQF